MAKWSIDPDKFFQDAELTANQKFRSFGLEALTRVILETPVDKGRLRGAWMLTLNTATPENPQRTFGENEQESTGPATQYALEVGSLSVAKAELTDVIIVQNNVEYGPYVNDGTETQAGQFFVERAIQSLTG